MRRPRFPLIIAALLAAVPASANGLSLEGGVTLGTEIPAGSAEDPVFGTLGFSARATYEGDRFALGVIGVMSISNKTSFALEAPGYSFSGKLPRREYGFGLLGRWFVGPVADLKRWYLEAQVLAMQTDFIHADEVYTLPQSPDYTRIFIQGGGFAFGLGYRPARGPWFYGLTYRLVRYETLQITGEVNYLHPVLAAPALGRTYFIHAIVLTCGLDVFGR